MFDSFLYQQAYEQEPELLASELHRNLPEMRLQMEG